MKLALFCGEMAPLDMPTDQRIYLTVDLRMKIAQVSRVMRRSHFSVWSYMYVLMHLNREIVSSKYTLKNMPNNIYSCVVTVFKLCNARWHALNIVN